MTQPAWRALTDTGAQTADYLDSAREDLHQLFTHSPKRVLDIGCAAGRVAQAINAKYNCEFTWGCELDPKAAAIAKTRLTYVSTQPMENWGEAEYDRLKTVDTVMLLDVLEHMYNPWNLLELLHKHLPDNAQIIISLPNIGNRRVIQDLINGYWHYRPLGILDVTHIRFFTEYEMNRMIYQTGFKVLFQGYIHTEPPQPAAQYPFELEMQGSKILVRDAAHWNQLQATQIVVHIGKADDAILNDAEKEIRHGQHPKTYTF